MKILKYLDQTYNLTVEGGGSGQTTIEEPLLITHTAEYGIYDHDWITVEHESSYSYVTEGLLGITERLTGVYSPWELITDERSTWLHLYNTNSDERTTLYERQYELASNRHSLVEREMILTERSTFYEVYEIFSADRKGFWGAFEEEFDTRDGVTNAVQEYPDERTCAFGRMETDERECVWWSAYDDYRWCEVVVWHESDRTCVTHAKLKDFWGASRTCHVELVDGSWETIRYVTLEVCSVSFELTIDPQYNDSYVTTINPLEVELFSEQVTPDVNQFVPIPVDFSNLDSDLLILEKNSTTPTECGSNPLHFMTFSQLTTNTWWWDGYIVPTKKVSFIKLSFNFWQKGALTDEEYYDYLIAGGYLNIVINGEPMSMNEAIVLDVPATTMVPFKIYVYDYELLDLENFNLVVKWAYPYNELTVHETLIVGVK